MMFSITNQALITIVQIISDTNINSHTQAKVQPLINLVAPLFVYVSY